MIGLVLVALVNLVCIDSLSKMYGVFGIFTLSGKLEIAVLVLFILLFAGYLTFAIYFAGIPRKRYWGFILLAAWLTLLFVPYHFVIEPWLLNYDLHSRKMMFPLNMQQPVFFCVFILCLAAVGIAGLWVFRKRKQEQQPGT